MRVDLCLLPSLDHEVIQVLDCYSPLECSTLIARDREDNNRMEEYLGKGKYLLLVFYLYRRILIVYHIKDR